MNALASLVWLMSAAAGVTVSGKVQGTDARPVSQHPVELQSKTGKASFYGVTDAQGNYSFYNIPAGSYVVGSVREPGARLDLSVDGAGKPVAVGPLTLSQSAPALRLQAEARDSGKRYGNGKTKYDFALWLDASPAVLGSIARVDYRLVYASNPLRLTGDPKNATRAFAATYIGWGCYEDVTAKIDYKNGTSETKRFDMCVALGWN
jgi:hypothetical protein